jgi:DNA-binding transcriptional regulator PaaX
MSKRTPKRTPLSKVLLTILTNLNEAAIDFTQLTAALQQGYGRAWRHGGQAYVAELKALRHQQTLRQTLAQLRRAKYLKAQRIGKRLLISLTAKGMGTTLAYRLRQAKPDAAGFSTVVIFDIPVAQNWARKQFRLLLKQGGFTKLQQSVWVSRADTYDMVTAFIKQIKLQQWVNVFRAKDFLHRPV